MHQVNEHASRNKSPCCADPDCESGLRNRYFDGKRLTPQSFRIEQTHRLQRDQLINRAIHGWGVVYGFGIDAVPASDQCRFGGLRIKAGFALDPHGREVLQASDTFIRMDRFVLLGESGKRATSIDEMLGFLSAQQMESPACWLLRVHYAEQKIDSVLITDRCRCEHQEWDHVCETVRYSLQPCPSVDQCCNQEGCALQCQCADGPCCDDRPEQIVSRGGCQCLCDHLIALDPKPDSDFLCDVEEPCGSIDVDLRNGIPLACVTLVRDECEAWTIDQVDACGPRRLIKRNDLLFDLIRGCDLTHITEIGWQEWHRRDEPVPLSEFKSAFGVSAKNGSVSEKLWLRFSRPVRRDNLLPDCFVMNVLVREGESGWWQTYRVPIERLQTRSDDTFVMEARVVVDSHWLQDAVLGGYTRFRGPEIRVEIEIHGDFIVDCNGQAVDANAVGLRAVPSGNGTPGGTFRSSFQVSPDLSK
jgi:hypothetical protein